MAHNLDISPSIQIKFSHIKCLSSDLISNLCPNDQPHIMEEVKRKIQIQTNLKSCQHLPFRKNVKNAIIQCRKKSQQHFHANLVNSSKCCKSIPPATYALSQVKSQSVVTWWITSDRFPWFEKKKSETEKTEKNKS